MEKYICADCGAVIEDEKTMITAQDGKTFCNKECADRKGYIQCEACGGWTDYWIMTTDDRCFCSKECAEEAGYYKCTDCGDWEPNCVEVPNQGMVCEYCREHGPYHQCEDCGDWCRDGDMCHDDSDIWVCDCCYNARWYNCDNCGCLVHADDVHSIDGYDYCEDCAEEIESGTIHNYSYKPAPYFYHTQEDFTNGTPLYMGVELEVDKGKNPEELAEELQVNVPEIYCKHDGSLDDGVEIVSHPCTLAYHMNELDWEWIREKCCEYGFTSHDAGTCGLHVHVNRNFFGNTQTEIDLNIAKAVLLVNRFWESHMIPFSRRTEEQLNHWASKNEITLEDDDNDATLASKARDLRNKGRYYAVNLRNANTIEFRLFRGTLKASTFNATLQFVDTLCRFAKKLNINDINKTTWEDIFRDVDYPDLIDYLTKRTTFHRQQEAA